MKAVFTYIYDDYAALNRAIERHGKWAKYSKFILILIVLVNLAISVFFIADALLNGFSLKLIYFANAGLALLLVLLVYVVRPLYLRSYYKKQMLEGKVVNLEFAEDGIEINMPDFKGKHNWSSIIRADEEPEHYLLWINKVQAYCVPKRAFENENDSEGFKLLVASKVEEQELVK